MLPVIPLLDYQDHLSHTELHCTFCVAGRTGSVATQMPDSVFRALTAAGLTLLSIAAALVVPASLGALRVALFGATDSGFE